MLLSCPGPMYIIPEAINKQAVDQLDALDHATRGKFSDALALTAASPLVKPNILDFLVIDWCDLENRSDMPDIHYLLLSK